MQLRKRPTLAVTEPALKSFRLRLRARGRLEREQGRALALAKRRSPMKPIDNWSVAFLAVLAIVLSPAALSAPSDAAAKTDLCAAPEYHQFDFWIGSWDVFDVENPNAQVASVRVDRILDGCVLREDYQDTNGYQGQSLTIYDAPQKAWHQSWVTNRGQVLLLNGRFQGGEMTLNAVEHTSDGKEQQIRGS